jgi:hypothetical protein
MSSAFTLLNAARPASQSSLLKLAETMTRTRAVPLGTWCPQGQGVRGVKTMVKTVGGRRIELLK